MRLATILAFSSAILIAGPVQAQGISACKDNPYGNSINDGRDYYVLLPSISQVVRFPPDIASRPIGNVFGSIRIWPHIINKKIATSGGASMQCATSKPYESYGWYGVGAFHQNYRAYASSIPGVGLRIDYRDLPVPTNPSSTTGIYLPIREGADAVISISLVKIGPITQAGTLSGVFLQLKYGDAVAAQYQFDRGATAPTGPACTVGHHSRPLGSPMQTRAYARTPGTDPATEPVWKRTGAPACTDLAGDSSGWSSAHWRPAHGS